MGLSATASLTVPRPLSIVRHKSRRRARTRRRHSRMQLQPRPLLPRKGGVVLLLVVLLLQPLPQILLLRLLLRHRSSSMTHNRLQLLMQQRRKPHPPRLIPLRLLLPTLRLSDRLAMASWAALSHHLVMAILPWSTPWPRSGSYRQSTISGVSPTTALGLASRLQTASSPLLLLALPSYTCRLASTKSAMRSPTWSYCLRAQTFSTQLGSCVTPLASSMSLTMSPLASLCLVLATSLSAMTVPPSRSL